MKLKLIQKRVNYLSFLILLAGILFISGCAQQPVSSSDKVILLNDEGRALLNSGNYEEAILYFDKALEIEPNNINALKYKGSALAMLGKYEEAIPYFDKALEIEPNNIDALNNKGSALAMLGNYEEAIPYFDKALEIEPNSVPVLKSKGAILINLGNYEEAILYFDKALEIEPNDVSALNNKGYALISLGKYEEAILYFDKALEIEPNDVSALKNKGLALDKLGKYEEARQYDRGVLELELIDIPVGKQYSRDFSSELIPLLPPESTGGPYTFYLGSGVGFPPMGLILGIDGVLRGTPTAAGNNNFQVCVKDVGGRSACIIYKITVNPAPASPAKTCPATSCDTGECCWSTREDETDGPGPHPAVNIVAVMVEKSCDCPSDTTLSPDQIGGSYPYKRCECNR